ncbi:transcriptional regulator, PadR family [Winkia neuii]|nr:transcriptional regulator, PadR family [Winkia neuii]
MKLVFARLKKSGTLLNKVAGIAREVAMAESQLRRGIVELAVMGTLASTPTYGGNLLSTIVQNSGLEITEGTLYPLLARMRKSGLVTTKWEPSPAGPPRKIYSLTAKGRTRLHDLYSEWQSLARAIELIMKGNK